MFVALRSRTAGTYHLPSQRVAFAQQWDSMASKNPVARRSGHASVLSYPVWPLSLLTTVRQYERFNVLLNEARGEIDAKKRTEMYGEMQRLVSDEGGTIIPFFRNWLYARRATVAHSGQLSANWPLDGARGAERWWFA